MYRIDWLAAADPLLALADALRTLSEVLRSHGLGKAELRLVSLLRTAFARELTGN